MGEGRVGRGGGMRGVWKWNREEVRGVEWSGVEWRDWRDREVKGGEERREGMCEGGEERGGEREC